MGWGLAWKLLWGGKEVGRRASTQALNLSPTTYLGQVTLPLGAQVSHLQNGGDDSTCLIGELY